MKEGRKDRGKGRGRNGKKKDREDRRRDRENGDREERRRNRKNQENEERKVEASSPAPDYGPDFFENFGADDSRCRVTPSSAVCSGRGTCVLGECMCNERDSIDEIVSGRFCECTNFLCDRYNGLLCSGPDHGLCECNRCLCRPGWTGDGCECEDSQSNCVNPETGMVCSGQGECECNQCRCFETEAGMYSGRWCEDCPICNNKCGQYKACVQCQAFGTGELTQEECYNQCPSQFNVTRFPLVEPETSQDRLCTFFDENDCRFTFVYGRDEFGQTTVRVKSSLECPPPSSSLGVDPGISEESRCRASPSSAVCSGRGICVEGQCKCSDATYWGRWCEECPTCQNNCERYKACVQCQAFGTGELAGEKCYFECFPNFFAFRVDVASIEAPREKQCVSFDERGCRFQFVYGQDEAGKLTLRVQTKLDCPQPRG